MKITKISIPEAKRSFSFGDRYGWITLSAGVEAVLDKPLDPLNKEDAEKIGKAYEALRKLIKAEFKAQYDHYKAQLNKANSGSTKKEVSKNE